MINKVHHNTWMKETVRSWWVVVFLLVIYGLYEQGVANTAAEMNKLIAYKEELLVQREASLNKQEKLKLQINSQSDPQWVIQTLKKGLGLVPNETTKIYFDPDYDKGASIDG